MNIPVAIAVPIYNARELTQRCIESVLAHWPDANTRLVLVDDASSDGALAAWLCELAAKHPDRMSLLVNEKNLGFTATANRAMREVRAGEDLLLLNSDTEVFPHFLERLQAAAHADPRCGVVTPFSNNATLCSIPEPFQDNPIPRGHSPASFDRLVEAVSFRARPQLVTAVGFCMYVKGAALAECGLFNEEAYGRGFGEENDFCEVAKARGWSIRLCDDLSVWHKGKASFGDEGRERERTNLKILEERHPGYQRAVQEFAHDNPLSILHERIKFHLERLAPGRESAMLFLLHASPYQPRPGGTEHHVLDLVQRLALPRALIAWPERDELVAAEILEGKIASPLRFERRLILPSQQFCFEHKEIEAALRDWISAFGVRACHVHHTMGWPASVLRVLGEANVPFIFTAHDFFAACPNWNLFDAAKNSVCPCDGSRECAESCLTVLSQRRDSGAVSGGDKSAADYRERHRDDMKAGLSQAAAILFPSRTTKAEFNRRLLLNQSQQGQVGVWQEVIGHGYDGAALRAIASKPPSPNGPLRVLVLGETGLANKGAANYLRAAEALRDAPVLLQFIGESARRVLQPELVRRGLGEKAIFLGRVERDALPAALGKLEPHAALLLPQVLETFSYVVSELGLAAIPIVTLDFGAPAERVRAHNLGVVVRDPEAAAAQLEIFARDRSQLAPYRKSALAFHHPTLEENAAAIRDVYAKSGLLKALDNRELPSAALLEQLREEHLHAAGISKSSSETRPIEPIARAEPPVSTYQKTSWYRAFAQVKNLVPGELRRYGRDLLLRRQHPSQLILDPARAELRDLKILRTVLGESSLQITGAQPRILFEQAVLAPLASVAIPLTLLRFRLRHDRPLGGRARLFWTNTSGEDLSEQKSLRIALARAPGIFQDYLVLLEELRIWTESAKSGPPQRLALELTDLGSSFELGPLELG